MKIPLVLAHGPGLEVFVVTGLVWMVLSYGLPWLAWTLAKKRKKVWAASIGVISVGFSSFSSVILVRDSLSIFLFFGLVPVLIGVAVLMQSFLIKSPTKR